MLKRKKIYICDHCEAIALPVVYYSFGDSWKGPPQDWNKLGDNDLCPTCFAAYSIFKEIAIKRDKNNRKD